jgi:hypothetical protein
MKIIAIIVTFLSISINMLAQDSILLDLESVAKYNDSVVTEINNLFVTNQGFITNCNALKKESQTSFIPYFKSINGHTPLYLLSFKKLEDSVYVLTILREGKYSPILTMFTFNKNFNFVQAFDLESSFVDAGQVEIYRTQGFDRRKFKRTYLTEWEKNIDGQGYSVQDSTITTFIITTQGIIQQIDEEKHQKEIKWE